MRGARVNSLVYAMREGLTKKVPELNETNAWPTAIHDEGVEGSW